MLSYLLKIQFCPNILWRTSLLWYLSNEKVIYFKSICNQSILLALLLWCYRNIDLPFQQCDDTHLDVLSSRQRRWLHLLWGAYFFTLHDAMVLWVFKQISLWFRITKTSIYHKTLLLRTFSCVSSSTSLTYSSCFRFVIQINSLCFVFSRKDLECDVHLFNLILLSIERRYYSHKYYRHSCNISEYWSLQTLIFHRRWCLLWRCHSLFSGSLH